ncbi:hypothetical protein P5W99_24515 [Paraburkholderia sp. A3BS-1L]|uniref:hypothetical protein n=1 Tax=Paraburkholderia sp. A3BS-1L TaxID=3028375 RepID=UPI003DA83B7B
MAIVREIWASPDALAKQLHRLPGRTTLSVYKMADRLKLVKQVRPDTSCRGMIIALMSDGKRRSVAEIAAATGFSIKTARAQSSILHEERAMHIPEYREPYSERVYVWGEGEDVPKPLPMAPTLARKLFPRAPKAKTAGSTSRIKRERPEQLAGAWWPSADQTVVSAMHSMVSVGRVAA